MWKDPLSYVSNAQDQYRFQNENYSYIAAKGEDMNFTLRPRDTCISLWDQGLRRK